MRVLERLKNKTPEGANVLRTVALVVAVKYLPMDADSLELMASGEIFTIAGALAAFGLASLMEEKPNGAKGPEGKDGPIPASGD